MKKIIVDPISSKKEKYEVIIGDKLLERLKDFINFSDYSKVSIITDPNIAFYVQNFKNAIHDEVSVIEVPSGEKNKNIEQVQMLWQKMIDFNLDRKSLVINLGGGVITDIGGLAASTYMRGITFINIPTTLLSQVDASIGGKTGIDFNGVKNLIGTFNQPTKVIIDIETLSSLPDREFTAGFAEIIKHGLIADKDYFQFVTSKKPKDFSKNELIEIISRSCEIKRDIVENDPTEKASRKTLNFGHTIGHAVEAISLDTKSPLLHGEAISIGMICEAKISQLEGLISEQDLKTVADSLKNAVLPLKINMDAEKIMKKMKTDKKSEKGSANLTLLKKIGDAIIDQNPKDSSLIAGLDYISK